MSGLSSGYNSGNNVCIFEMSGGSCESVIRLRRGERVIGDYEGTRQQHEGVRERVVSKVEVNLSVCMPMSAMRGVQGETTFSGGLPVDANYGGGHSTELHCPFTPFIFSLSVCVCVVSSTVTV